MTGLEERGVHDNPLRHVPRSVWEYLDGRHRYALRMVGAQSLWQLLWGVPVGPTLSQVPGASPGPLGLLAATERTVVLPSVDLRDIGVS